MQDGIDLITALAVHPETARRLARKFWSFFISEVHAPDPTFVTNTANVYLQSATEIRPVVRYVLTSPWFADPAVRHARYSWPAEFVARAIKEAGWQNFSLDQARAPMANMGMQLFEPPDVGGWPLGQGWFSTSTMLARIQLRGRARVQPEGLPGRRARAGWPDRPGTAGRHARAGHAGAIRSVASTGAHVLSARRRGLDRERGRRSAHGLPGWRAC